MMFSLNEKLAAVWKTLGSYTNDNPLSAKSARKVVKIRALAPETAMNFAADAIHQILSI